MGDELWEVVGGADKGGILVRSGRDTKSPELAKRLSFGSLVQQMELQGDRLRYLLLEGAGPETGWVSVKLKDKELMARRRRATDKAPLAALPLSADHERRMNTRKALQAQIDAMPALRSQFQWQIDALDQEDAKELAGHLRSAPSAAMPTRTALRDPSSGDGAESDPSRRFVPQPGIAPAAVQQVPSAAASTILGRSEADDDDEVLDIAPPSAADFLKALDVDEGNAEVASVDGPNVAESVLQMVNVAEDVQEQSMEDLLARIDSELDGEAFPEAPPSLEDMLASLEKDEAEEQEYEDAIRERDRFFDLGNIAGTAIANQYTDPFAHLTSDTVSQAPNFSFANISEFGNLCLAKARARNPLPVKEEAEHLDGLKAGACNGKETRL